MKPTCCSGIPGCVTSADWIVARQGAQLDVENLILTQGSAQGLALVANTLVGPGDGVIIEETTFRCTTHFMRCAGGVIATVPVDDNGMDVDAVEACLKDFARRRIRPKIIYTIPTFHLPTGTVLARERRDQLLALAAAWNVIVLEDNVYAELRYAGSPVPSLLALDQHGSVVQSDSFSKMIAPGIRLGWLAGPEELIDTMAAVRQDLGVSQLLSRIMELYMRTGDLAAHIDEATAVYRRKRDVAMAAMDAHCGNAVSYRVPEGSFYLWVEMDAQLDWTGVRAKCLERGVYYRPGEMFATDQSSRQYFRLAFSYLPESDIEEGIRILGQVLSENQGT